MGNVKLAFERYMDFIVIQRRDSILKLTCELPSIISPTTTTSSSSSIPTLSRQTSFTTDRVYTLSRPQPRSLSLRQNLRLIKRDFTSTRTKYVDNNLDIIVDNDTSSVLIQSESVKKFEAICDELKYFDNKSPESFTPDIILNVSKTFDWLYSNKQFKLCYKLLKRLTPESYPIFFKFNHYNKIIELFDKFGIPNDLFSFCEVFKYEKLPNFWRKIIRLSNDPLIKELIEFANVQSFNDAKPKLVKLLSSDIEGLKYFALRVSSLLYKNFDIESRITFYTFLLDEDNDKFKKYFPPSLIIQIFESYSENVHDKFNLQYQFLENFLKPHYDINSDSENNFSYRLISTISKVKHYELLKFKIWFYFCYNERDHLKYDREINSIIYLRNNKMHYLPNNFERIIEFNNEDLSTVLSILIYTHSRYENTPFHSQNYYHLKEKLSLPIYKSDKIGYLKSLTVTKKYSKAKVFLEKCLQENPKFESSETLNPILIVLAKNKQWSQLEDIYTERYENNEIITKEQYITLFLALSIRSGTNKIIIELWENYLKRGFEPVDQVLSSIIFSFINNKSYDLALQWFSAYSHYNVELTSKSYGLMLHALAGTRNIESVFKVLDELVNKQVRLPKVIFTPIFAILSEIGDFRSIELILLNYYPKLNLVIERDDSRWIMKCHYHSQRFNVIVDTYLEMPSKEIDYKDSLLALESSLKYTNMLTFEKVWEKSFKLHEERGDLDVKAYIYYMSYWVRKYGVFGVEKKLEEIRDAIKINEFPTSLFNQMIFSGFRTFRPWLTKRIIKLALSNNVILSPKTYSLILQSNVSMPWIARNSINETVLILEEFLQNRKSDKFGVLNDDINPMSFKLVIKAIIKYKDAFEARRLFDMYVELSPNDLTNNIHILNIELMLLGEEARWLEFDQSYDKFLSLIVKLNKSSRLQNEDVLNRYDSVGDFNRLSLVNDSYMRVKIDEGKLSNSTNAKVKIPTWIKKSHYDLWGYRLKQLDFAERLDEVIPIMEQLNSKGIVFSNKNLNETALYLSEKPELVEECSSFIDRFILPWHIQNRRMKMMKLRYRTDQIPGLITKPTYELNNEIYYQIIKNLSISLDKRLSPDQRASFLQNLSSTPNKYILKNMDKLLNDRRHMRSSYLQTKKLRTLFYRNLRQEMKRKKVKAIKRSYMFRINKLISYNEKMRNYRNEMISIVSQINQFVNKSTKEGKRNYESNPVMKKLISEKKRVRGRIRSLKTSKEFRVKQLMEADERKAANKEYQVDGVDIDRF